MDQNQSQPQAQSGPQSHLGDKIYEKDLIPNGRTIPAIPTYAAPEGTEVTYYNSGTARRYKMVSGQWFYMPLLTLLAATATYNPPSLAAGDSSTTSITVTGAQIGDFVLISFSLPTQNVQVWGYVEAADTVWVRFVNSSGSTVDLASGTINIRVIPQAQL